MYLKHNEGTSLVAERFDYSFLCDEIETNPKSPKFKIGDRFRITKYKNIFGKGYTENW